LAAGEDERSLHPESPESLHRSLRRAGRQPQRAAGSADSGLAGGTHGAGRRDRKNLPRRGDTAPGTERCTEPRTGRRRSVLRTAGHASTPMSRRELKQVGRGLAFLSPWLLGFLAFTLLPIGLLLYYSLCDYSLLQPPLYLGVENY